MEPPDNAPEAAAAPTAEEAVPVIAQDAETAPLVEPQPEPAAELDGVRVDVTEQRQREPEQEDGAQPMSNEQGDTISITLKEFVTGNAFQVSIAPDADIAALKRLIHEEHDGAAEPDGQRLLLNDSPLEDETEKLCDHGIADGAELRLGAQDAAEGRARREVRREGRATALRDSLGERYKETISDETALCLVDAGCRTEADVWSLSTEALATLPDDATEEVTQAKEVKRVAEEQRIHRWRFSRWLVAVAAGASVLWVPAGALDVLYTVGYSGPGVPQLGQWCMLLIPYMFTLMFAMIPVASTYMERAKQAKGEVEALEGARQGERARLCDADFQAWEHRLEEKCGESARLERWKRGYLGFYFGIAVAIVGLVFLLMHIDENCKPCENGQCDWQTYTCVCYDGFAGDRCEGNCAPAEHTTGVSVDGLTCDCTEGFAGEICEGNCSDHGGVSEDGMACANCTGNWIGTLCDTECGCYGRGNQTNLTAARAAGSCAAGSCACEGNNLFGALCQFDGQWLLGNMTLQSEYNGATVRAVEYTGNAATLSSRTLTWELQHGLCAAAGRATPGSDLLSDDRVDSRAYFQDKYCAYSPSDNYVVTDGCGWRNQEFTHVSGSLGGSVGWMCAGYGCAYQVRVEGTNAASGRHRTATLKSGDAVFCSA
eukprot:COSAG04_NODE_351_length_16103_cov_3.615413_14_plen_658_part_00